MVPSRVLNSVAKLPTKSAKIRALAEQGYARADIARALGIRYQHARNVLERAKPRQETTLQPVESNHFGGPSPRNPTKVTLGPAGRVVIPAPVREAVGFKEGDVLFGR